MTPFEAEFFEKLRRHLNLMHLDLANVTAQTSLFDGGLDLDSIDVLEISTLLQKEYGVVVSVAERSREIFGTVGTLAAFAEQNRGRNPEGH